MPGLDRTGPMGQGSRTGKQMGKCAPRQENNEDDRFENWAGRGVARGAGREMGQTTGRGMGRGPGRGAGKGRYRGGF